MHFCCSCVVGRLSWCFFHIPALTDIRKPCLTVSLWIHHCTVNIDRFHAFCPNGIKPAQTLLNMVRPPHQTKLHSKMLEVKELGQLCLEIWDDSLCFYPCVCLFICLRESVEGESEGKGERKISDSLLSREELYPRRSWPEPKPGVRSLNPLALQAALMRKLKKTMNWSESVTTSLLRWRRSNRSSWLVTHPPSCLCLILLEVSMLFFLNFNSFLN